MTGRKQAILWTILLIGGLLLILTLAGCNDYYDMPNCLENCAQGGNDKSRGDAAIEVNPG